MLETLSRSPNINSEILISFMRNWNHPDWDQQLFNRLVLIADAALKHGLPQAWFSWLGWIGITSLLFSAGRATQSVGLLVASAFSVVVLFFVGLAGAERLVDIINERVAVKIWHEIAVILAFSIAAPYFVMEIMGALLEFSNA